MDLNKEQKEFLRVHSKEMPDLIDLTKKCFGDESLDGRSKEGRAVRKFLVENSIKFKTTSRIPAEVIHLSSEQCAFILQQAEDGLSSLEVAKIIFQIGRASCRERV